MHTQLVCHEDLTDAQQQQLRHLEVLPEQKAFSGDIYSALQMLLDSPGGDIRGFVLLADTHPIGFFLLKRGPFLPHWAQKGAVTLHALQIDRRMQGHGLGKVCLQALPEMMRRVWPEVAQVMLSVDADNRAAMGLYRGLGWVDTGHAYRGRVGFERRLVLGLR
ncbi:MAG: family acetyltransferase [Pseudomonas sp.]|nr:family acetyltransferase [Pseudomonas sp.]